MLTMANGINVQHFKKFLNRNNDHPIAMLNEYLIKIGLHFNFEELECTGQPPQIQYKYRVFVQNEHGGENPCIIVIPNAISEEPFRSFADVVYEAEGVGPNKKIAKGTAADKLIEVLQGDDKRNDSPDTPEFLREM